MRLVALALLAAVPQLAVAASPQVEAKRGELKNLQGRLEALSRDLAKSEENRAEATDQLKETESGISDINRSLRQLGELRAGKEAEVGELERQAQQVGTLIATQQAQLGRLLYRQFVAGEADALQLMLSGADPNQVARDLHYLDLLARARADLLRRLDETLASKQRLREAAQAKREELAAIEDRRSRERSALLKQQGRHQEILARLASRIKAQRTEIDSLKRNEKRLSVLIEALARIVAKPVPAKAGSKHGRSNAAGKRSGEAVADGSGVFARQKGRLALPVRGVIASRYGSPRGEGGGTWKGVFITAGEGSEVHALAAGRVVFADWLRGFGNLLVLDHGDNYLSVYGNNQSLFRQLGDSVAAGETLAAVGSSGGNSQTGLYFELRHQGQALDPLKWVASK